MDYYQILGVLSDAEHIVIVAAYRALAGKYHPDKWSGNVDEANKRMAELNVAYAVLSNPEKRKQYDQSRATGNTRMDDDVESNEDAFESAMDEYEDKWSLACEIYPDLDSIRKRLSKTARRLAFAFMILIVEGKHFKHRHDLANAMEEKFLQTYFGTNPKIIEYAKQLIEWGFKDAVKKLNAMADLLGSDIEDGPVIDRIEKQFSLVERRNGSLGDKKKAERLQFLKRAISMNPVSEEAFEYALLIGCHIVEVRGGMFKPDYFAIKKFNDGPVLFETKSRGEMSFWIRNNIVV